MLTLQEWQEEGIKKFGPDKRKWKFKCPVCKTVATVQEYIDLGDKEGATAGFSCIGRLKKKTQSAFLGGKKKLIPGEGCDYAGGSLFQLNPVQILAPSQKVGRMMEFAE